MTSFGEKYQCLIPENPVKMLDSSRITKSKLNESELLRPLFTHTSCFIKAEHYWTYELCHNQHVRQYHELYTENKVLNV